MPKPLVILIAAVAAVSGWAQPSPDQLVLVEGGTFKNRKSAFYARSMTSNPHIGRTVSVASFYIGKYEVTQKEWVDVMGSNPSKIQGDTLPVDTVSWYDCVEYCNRRSAKEGLTPYYTIVKDRKDPNNGTEMDDVKWTVTINPGANGYRLPTEAEWEYAASGGQLSKGYTYSGSNDIEKVAWYWQNAGDERLQGLWNWPLIEQNNNKSQPVGEKQPNELGLHDMSGNVREWCWNWYADAPSHGAGPEGGTLGRVWKGGGWMGGDFCCEPAFRASFEANGKGPDQGFRVCRDR